MNDKFPRSFNMHDDDNSLESDFSVASSTDCTGLIPSAPTAEHEVDSYNELYDVPLASDPNEANNHMQDIQKTETSLFPPDSKKK